MPGLDLIKQGEQGYGTGAGGFRGGDPAALAARLGTTSTAVPAGQFR